MIYFMTEAFWDFQFEVNNFTFYPPRADFVSNTTRFRDWVVLIPESGRFRFQLDTCAGEIAFGQWLCVAPRERFDRFALEPISYHVLQFSVDEDSSLESGTYRTSQKARLRSTLEQMRQVWGRDDARARSRLENLLGDVWHLAASEESGGESGRKRVEDALMARAAHLLREKAGEAFAMRIISDQLGLGAVAFTRRFRTVWHQNPVEFLTECRLERASELLLETDANLDEIARKCGYNSGAYLSAVWKTARGGSPGKFRQAHRV